jgi:hypothetical protein
VRTLQLPDLFQDHASQQRLYADAGLDANAIVATALALVAPALANSNTAFAMSKTAENARENSTTRVSALQKTLSGVAGA